MATDQYNLIFLYISGICTNCKNIYSSFIVYRKNVDTYYLNKINSSWLDWKIVYIFEILKTSVFYWCDLP